MSNKSTYLFTKMKSTILMVVLFSFSLTACAQKNEKTEIKTTNNMKYNTLTPDEERVILHKGTERPYTGELLNNKAAGTYVCKRCDAPLYRSEDKFESHCGWPSFFSPLAGDKIIEVEDNSLGMKRVEVLCANCKSHLGHVFAGEGYDTPTDLRYCINSISLKLEPTE